jgi:hypothetical protein
MKRLAFLTAPLQGAIIKQVADWCRTISAGAIILGMLNPAIVGVPELANKALYIMGFPGIALCLLFTITAVRIEARKGG